MKPEVAALLARAHSFFIRVIRFCESLPDNAAVRSIRPQLLDSSGSTDSNYRAACKARTRKEFIAKVGVAAEEADESLGWLDALLQTGYGDRSENEALIQEADELTRIFVRSHQTASRRLTEAEEKKKTRRRRLRQN